MNFRVGRSRRARLGLHWGRSFSLLIVTVVVAQPQWGHDKSWVDPQTDPCFCADAGGIWYTLPDMCCHLEGRHENDPMDGTVDMKDLLYLLAMWGQCPMGECCGADINRDRWVDEADVALMISHWGQHPMYFTRCRELP